MSQMVMKKPAIKNYIRQYGNIEMRDYFDINSYAKFLHFFQDNSRFIHIIDLEKISKDPESQRWNRIELQEEVRIPIYHRSIITPFGEIYLTGGIDANKRVTNATYYLNQETRRLELVGLMSVARCKHGICYSYDNIFVVGGCGNNDENISLDSCERYDIKANQWKKLASCKYKCFGCTFTNFQNKCLFKFGGKVDSQNLVNSIEKYDIIKDMWFDINLSVQSELLTHLPAFASSCQINNEEVLIIGGQYAMQKNSDKVLVFRVNDNGTNECELYQSYNLLPDAGTFWGNGIICGQVLFTVQNVSSEKLDQYDLSRKIPLAYNSKVWKRLEG